MGAIRGQCDWEYSHEHSSSFLSCVKRAGHGGNHAAHFERPGAVIPPVAPGEDRRPWVPGWFADAVLAQDRQRLYGPRPAPAPAPTSKDDK